MPLGLVYTQVLLISHSTHSVKLPFFQKAATVVVIVNATCGLQGTGWGVCTRLIHYLSKRPSPLLPHISLQKLGVHFQKFTVIQFWKLCNHNHMLLGWWLTNAALSVLTQWVPIHAAALKATKGVITIVVTPTVVSSTLINICMWNGRQHEVAFLSESCYSRRDC